jgi:ATP-dependent DNA ligase
MPATVEAGSHESFLDSELPKLRKRVRFPSRAKILKDSLVFCCLPTSVIGGYTPSGRNFDALIIGYYEKGNLLYAGRTRNGFTPALRMELMKRLRPLQADTCPFANLPEKKTGRWGQGLTAAKMKECRCLRPALVGHFEFVEWTSDLHLRHTRFVALREEKTAMDVQRETP